MDELLQYNLNNGEKAQQSVLPLSNTSASGEVTETSVNVQN